MESGIYFGMNMIFAVSETEKGTIIYGLDKDIGQIAYKTTFPGRSAPDITEEQIFKQKINAVKVGNLNDILEFL